MTPSTAGSGQVAPEVTFFSWHERDELRLQRCARCSRWQHPPLVTCPACGAADLVWQPVCGWGRVFSWTVTRYPLVAAFESCLPYVNAVVETDEGPRVFTLLVDAAPEEVRIGLPVRVSFREVGGRRLAVFEPVTT